MATAQVDIGTACVVIVNTTLLQHHTRHPTIIEGPQHDRLTNWIDGKYWARTVGISLRNLVTGISVH